jgi:hypothetical protein
MSGYDKLPSKLSAMYPSPMSTSTPYQRHQGAYNMPHQATSPSDASNISSWLGLPQAHMAMYCPQPKLSDYMSQPNLESFQVMRSNKSTGLTSTSDKTVTHLCRTLPRTKRTQHRRVSCYRVLREAGTAGAKNKAHAAQTNVMPPCTPRSRHCRRQEQSARSTDECHIAAVYPEEAGIAGAKNKAHAAQTSVMLPCTPKKPALPAPRTKRTQHVEQMSVMLPCTPKKPALPAPI